MAPSSFFVDRHMQEWDLDTCCDMLTWTALYEYLNLDIMEGFVGCHGLFCNEGLFPTDELQRILQAGSTPVLDKVREMIQQFASSFQQCNDEVSRKEAFMEAVDRIHKFVYESNRQRHKLTAAQERRLEEVFSSLKYISIRFRSELSEELGLTEREVKIWFQNRRQKDRHDMRIKEYHIASRKIDDAIELEYFPPLEIEDVFHRSTVFSRLMQVFSMMKVSKAISAGTDDGGGHSEAATDPNEPTDGNPRSESRGFRKGIHRFKASIRKWFLCS